MLTVGRLCVKTAGRDAMEYCVVVEEMDNTYVLVDGNVRRKKVNKAHLEPISKTLDIKKGADTKTVLEAFAAADIEVKKSTEKKEKKVKATKAPAKKAAASKKTTKKE